MVVSILLGGGTQTEELGTQKETETMRKRSRLLQSNCEEDVTERACDRKDDCDGATD